VSRWKYRTATVTVGENSIEVRQFTTEERRQFHELHKAARESGSGLLGLQKQVMMWTVITAPALTEEDARTMPPELTDAAVEKVMELSGLAADETDEKKAPTTEPGPNPN
jgi:hypothetical protein